MGEVALSDPIAGVVAFLAADAGVAALVGARVFGGEMPASEAKHMPRPALVVRESGGPSLGGGTYAAVEAQRLDLFAFGASAHEAGKVMRAASVALHRMRRGVWADTLLYGCNYAGGSMAGREPGTEWPRQFRSFQLLHALFERLGWGLDFSEPDNSGLLAAL